METEDLCLQLEEIETLGAIYGADWCDVDAANRIFSIRIDDALAGPRWSVQLQVTFAEGYPRTAPPGLQIGAPWLRGGERRRVERLMDEVYGERVGEPVVYACIERIREYLQEKAEGSPAAAAAEVDEDDADSGGWERPVPTPAADCPPAPAPALFHGEPLTDRRSVFQAHLAGVRSREEVGAAMQLLLANRKVAGATHNISAWAVRPAGGGLVSECCDDGEHGAGGRLLHLLRLTGAENVLVVVSRWFGGILLGPDRFKHILNVARSLLVERGFVGEGGQRRGPVSRRK